MQIKRTYRSDIEEHAITVDGTEVATAHPVAVGRWSIKVDGRFAGLALNEHAAVTQLDRYVDKLRAMLAA